MVASAPWKTQSPAYWTLWCDATLLASPHQPAAPWLRYQARVVHSVEQVPPARSWKLEPTPASYLIAALLLLVCHVAVAVQVKAGAAQNDRQRGI